MTSMKMLNGFDTSKGNLTYPTVVPLSTGNVIIEMTAAERWNLVYLLENPNGSSYLQI